MAREIYADPFGSYIGGYDLGAQREQQIQRGVRDAREMDWNYYNMNPIALETAQRNNAFQAYGDQFQRQLLPIGVRNAQANLFTNEYNAAQPFEQYGILGPTGHAMASYMGPDYGYVASNEGIQFSRDGAPIGPMASAQRAISARPERRLEDTTNAQTDWQHKYLIGNQAVDYNNSVSSRINADAQAARTPGANGAIGYEAMAPLLWGGAPATAPPTTEAPVAAPPPVQSAPAVQPQPLPPDYNATPATPAPVPAAPAPQRTAPVDSRAAPTGLTQQEMAQRHQELQREYQLKATAIVHSIAQQSGSTPQRVIEAVRQRFPGMRPEEALARFYRAQ